MISTVFLRISFILILLRLFVPISYSQDINQYYNRGLKQGEWLYSRVDTTGPHFNYYIGGFRSSRKGKPDTLHMNLAKRPKRYHIKSQIFAKGNYLDNEPDGHWIYYRDIRQINKEKTREELVVHKSDSIFYEYQYCKEIPKYEIEYKSGMIHGMYKMYYSDGTTKSEINFVDNKPLGSINTYHDNGNVMFVGELFPDEQFYILTEYYYTGSSKGIRKLSISYIMENFTNLDEVKEIHSGF